MEELVDIIITLIGRWLQSGAKKPTVPTNAPIVRQAAQKARSAPVQRAVIKMQPATRKPASKAVARRVNPATVAVARPIVTNTTPVSAPAVKPPVKAVNARQIEPATRSTKVPLSAASIKKWLNPTTLQQQFMLTEIFKPPVALRDHQEI